MGVIEQKVGELGFIAKVDTHLDHTGFRGLFVLGYRLLDDREDPWTKAFDSFKHGDGAEPAARAMAVAIASGPLQNVDRAVVVGAIPSALEVLPRGSAVYRMGEAIAHARAPGWVWRPDLLRKAVHVTRHLGSGSAAERDAVVDRVYNCGDLGEAAGTAIIVDDFCTRGATFAEITRAIRAVNPYWETYGVALAKNERRSFAHVSNDHISQEMLRMWQG